MLQSLFFAIQLSTSMSYQRRRISMANQNFQILKSVEICRHVCHDNTCTIPFEHLMRSEYFSEHPRYPILQFQLKLRNTTMRPREGTEKSATRNPPVPIIHSTHIATARESSAQKPQRKEREREKKKQSFIFQGLEIVVLDFLPRCDDDH